MHTTDNNVKNKSNPNKAKDIAVPPAKKIDGASMAPQAADKAKEQMMPVEQKASTDAAKESCDLGKDGKPEPLADKSISKSASQHAADKNGGYKMQGESAKQAASTGSAKKDVPMPSPVAKAPEKRAAPK